MQLEEKLVARDKKLLDLTYIETNRFDDVYFNSSKKLARLFPQTYKDKQYYLTSYFMLRLGEKYAIKNLLSDDNRVLKYKKIKISFFDRTPVDGKELKSLYFKLFSEKSGALSKKISALVLLDLVKDIKLTQKEYLNKKVVYLSSNGEEFVSVFAIYLKLCLNSMCVEDTDKLTIYRYGKTLMRIVDETNDNECVLITCMPGYIDLVKNDNIIKGEIK